MNTEEIWKQYHLRLYAFVLKMVKQQEVAEDILQATFIKIHQKIGQLKDQNKLQSWVFQIARNEVYDHFKSRTTILLPEELPISTEVEETPLCCFDKFLDQLPEIYAAPMRLVYIDGRSQAEAAEELEISLANLKARIRRAKSTLKDQFAACCKFELNKNGKLIGEPNCSACSE
ncbi:sigma-70 family RNA polymerase sigma factor [Dyadobacter tibetensis]|uniref:sigma-70 family RNA polymerase sigma factor n=1 Tax=Dyadobacter tibetensis TaxID=1211851 RepID=UPI00047142FC|nr:sigma-70 family RNA polymerase sigma factor [Dyadobacter tibetensis]